MFVSEHYQPEPVEMGLQEPTQLVGLAGGGLNLVPTRTRAGEVVTIAPDGLEPILLEAIEKPKGLPQ